MGKINNVILIDDDEINNFLSYRLIKKLGVADHIYIFHNGLEAINYMQQLAYDSKICPELILLDINMPVMDGYEFLKAFHNLTFKNKEAIKIITVTTSNRHEDFERMQKLGVECIFSKPLCKQKLEEIITSI